MEIGKRYRKITTIQYVEDERGQFLAMRGPGGNIGLMDLSKKTHLGLPKDPATGTPFVGFAENEVNVVGS